MCLLVVIFFLNSGTGTINLCSKGQFKGQFNYGPNSPFINKGKITASAYFGSGTITNKDGGITETCN